MPETKKTIVSSTGRVGKAVARQTLAACLVAAALGALGCENRSGTSPQPEAPRLAAPPRVDLEGADPAVIEAVRSARDKVAAARRDPRDPRWPYLQALALLEGRPDPQGALPALKTAAELATGEPAPRLKLGEVLLEQGHLDEARRQFQLALELDAGNARARLGLGRVAYLRGDLKEAIEHLASSARAAPRVKATRALLAELYFRQGDRDSAEQERQLMAGLPDTHRWPDPYFDQVLERWVGALARIERANDLFGRGRREEAIGLLEETIRLHPNALLAHLVLGRFRLQSNQLVEAETALRRAVAIAPDAFEAHHELGTALEGQGKPAEAAECFERAILIKPEYAPAHYHLGRCRLEQGDHRGALEALTATVRFKPDYAEAQRALGHLLAQSGRYAEAVVHLRRAVRLSPADEKARLLLREVERQLGRE